jgi:hypothetical protein
VTIETKSFLSNDSSLAKYQELKHPFGNSQFAAEIREVLDSPFEVMLMAPMSSGKSTGLGLFRECFPMSVYSSSQNHFDSNCKPSVFIDKVNIRRHITVKTKLTYPMERQERDQ